MELTGGRDAAVKIQALVRVGEGTAEIIGPDDPHPGVDAERLRPAPARCSRPRPAGSHDDWDAYDAEMVAQGRTAVLVTPTRIYSN